MPYFIQMRLTLYGLFQYQLDWQQTLDWQQLTWTEDSSVLVFFDHVSQLPSVSELFNIGTIYPFVKNLNSLGPLQIQWVKWLKKKQTWKEGGCLKNLLKK